MKLDDEQPGMKDRMNWMTENAVTSEQRAVMRLTASHVIIR